MAYRLDGLAALGDPTRRTIFELVAERPRAVVSLAPAMPASRAAPRGLRAPPRHARQPPRRLPAPEDPQGRRPRHRPPRSQPPHLRRLPRRSRGAARVPRAVLDHGARVVQSHRRATTTGGLMSTQVADTSVRTSIVVDAPLE